MSPRVSGKGPSIWEITGGSVARKCKVSGRGALTHDQSGRCQALTVPLFCSPQVLCGLPTTHWVLLQSSIPFWWVSFDGVSPGVFYSFGPWWPQPFSNVRALPHSWITEALQAGWPGHIREQSWPSDHEQPCGILRNLDFSASWLCCSFWPTPSDSRSLTVILFLLMGPSTHILCNPKPHRYEWDFSSFFLGPIQITRVLLCIQAYTQLLKTKCVTPSERERCST